jgi:hypothetical protein
MPKVMFYVDLSRVKFDGNDLVILLPQVVKDMLSNKLRVEESEKYKFVFDVERKKKPRTTGPKGPDGKGSQQYHLHGHLQQIADYTGFYMSEIKEAMKKDIPEWPCRTVMGETVYASEADADTILEAKAIEWCHVKAAFLGVILKED